MWHQESPFLYNIYFEHRFVFKILHLLKGETIIFFVASIVSGTVYFLWGKEKSGGGGGGGGGMQKSMCSHLSVETLK